MPPTNAFDRSEVDRSFEPWPRWRGRCRAARWYDFDRASRDPPRGRPPKPQAWMYVTLANGRSGMAHFGERRGARSDRRVGYDAEVALGRPQWRRQASIGERPRGHGDFRHFHTIATR
jgi:hypothetical protein